MSTKQRKEQNSSDTTEIMRKVFNVQFTVIAQSFNNVAMLRTVKEIIRITSVINIQANN